MQRPRLQQGSTAPRAARPSLSRRAPPTRACALGSAVGSRELGLLRALFFTGLYRAAEAGALRLWMAAAAESGSRTWPVSGSPRLGSPAGSPVLGISGGVRPVSGPERTGRAIGPAVPGHSFRKVTLTKPTFCHLCSDFIWGLAGFLCDGESPPCVVRPLPRTGALLPGTLP